ncbi:unnamed protein product [Mesocestoides corti]|uniref:Uncharacterized protein n=1 Tax=Mesocestoides corti TaxID=53468 RepID=A0A0R3UCQ7_MESCO|nr:unnamed protein product [Mesocestoides corti]
MVKYGGALRPYLEPSESLCIDVSVVVLARGDTCREWVLRSQAGLLSKQQCGANRRRSAKHIAPVATIHQLLALVNPRSDHERGETAPPTFKRPPRPPPPPPRRIAVEMSHVFNKTTIVRVCDSSSPSSSSSKMAAIYETFGGGDAVNRIDGGHRLIVLGVLATKPMFHHPRRERLHHVRVLGHIRAQSAPDDAEGANQVTCLSVSACDSLSALIGSLFRWGDPTSLAFPPPVSTLMKLLVSTFHNNHLHPSTSIHRL